jgi:hypothetical protein
MKKSSRFVAAALVAAALAVPAGAATIIRVAPPPLRTEAIVARPGPRHVWVPGWWRWSGREYVWVPGAWRLPPRHRTAWVPGHYAHRRHGWVWIRGHWR